LQENFAAEETVKIEPTTGAARRSDRDDQGVDDQVNRDYQQAEAEKKERSCSSNAGASTTKRWSR
jgi:hypothetical protein